MDKIKFVINNFWKKVKSIGGKLPFIKDAVAMYYAMLDPDVPLKVKILIASALAYFIVPLDTIPDFTPITGYLDDFGVITAVVELVHPYIIDHYDEAERFLSES